MDNLEDALGEDGCGVSFGDEEMFNSGDEGFDIDGAEVRDADGAGENGPDGEVSTLGRGAVAAQEVEVNAAVGSSRKRKSHENDDQGRVKRVNASARAKDEGDGVGPSVDKTKKSTMRAKRLVSRTQVGLKRKGNAAPKEGVVYESSTDDDEYTDPETGEKRQRVGYLFRRAPGPMMERFVTADDTWKLNKYSLVSQVRRAEKSVARVSVKFCVCVLITNLCLCCC